MKKVLVAILVLVLCITALVACNPTADTEALNTAKEYLTTMYKNAAVETGKDFTRPVKVPVGNNVFFDVEWSIEIKSGPNEISVSEAKDGIVTINLDEFSSSEIVYVLKATIKDSKGNTETITWNHKVPKFVVNTWEEYLAAGDADSAATIKGYVVGVNADIEESRSSSSAGSLWIVDEEGHGYYAYKPALDASILASRESAETAFAVGTEVVVKGTVDNFGGCYEFIKDCEVILTGNKVDESELPYVDRTEMFTNATAINDASLLEAQATRVAVNGVTMGAIDGNNYYFTIGDVDFIFYMNIYLLTRAEQDTLKAMWVEGGKANLKGVVNVYSGNYQIYPDSLASLEIVQETLTDAEKVARQKEVLTLATSAEENFTLPTGTWADIAWAVEGEGAVIGEDGLSVTITRTNADQTVTFTATITSGEAVDTKTFDVVIKSSVIDWKNVAWAVEECAKLDGSTKEISAEEYYFYGTVGEIYNTEYCNFYLVDEAGNSIIVYGLYAPNGTDRYGSKRQIAEIPFAEGDLICMRGNLQNYDGKYEIINAVEVETPAKGSSVINPYNATEGAAICGALDGATKEMTEDAFYFIGTVHDIYNTQYCNFHLVDDAEGDLTVYGLYAPNGTDRYGSKREIAEIPFAEGDTILLKGKLQNYNGTLQISGAVLVSFYTPESGETPDPNPGEGGETPDPNPGEGGETPEPTGTITTIEGALAAEVGSAAELQGTVTEITYAWNGSTCSFYLSDGSKKILVYKATTQVGLGDVVKVVGTIGNYNGNQIGEGSTTTVLTAHVCSSYTEADCLNPAKCVVCGTANGTALGHVDTDANNVCDRCETNLSAPQPTLAASLSFADKANRTSWDVSQQTWSQNGITLKNEKGSSTSNVADYASPARFYKSSNITVEYAGMIKVVFNCNSNDYATALAATLTGTDYTVSVEGKAVTVVFANATDSLNITKLSAQVRIDSIDVYTLQ